MLLKNGGGGYDTSTETACIITESTPSFRDNTAVLHDSVQKN